MTNLKKNIFAISGSTRNNSVNVRILKAIASMYAAHLNMDIFEALHTLPHFHPDTPEEDTPKPVKYFLDKIKNADGVLICTPEYVFSVPGALKNALEWTVSTTVFSYKPTAYIVASGLGQKTFESLDLILKTLVQTEIPLASKLLIQGSRSKVSEDGEILDASVQEHIQTLIRSLIQNMDADRPFAENP